MAHDIHIEVQFDGTTKLETRGFQGASCRDADKWLRNGLGLTITDQPTQEMYVVAQTTTQKVRT